MPNIASAAKALRQSKKRREVNQQVQTTYREAVKTAREKPTHENIRKAYSSLDRAAKNNVIHKNKAARTKARLSSKASSVSNA